jgi:hypothetical protein
MMKKKTYHASLDGIPMPDRIKALKVWARAMSLIRVELDLTNPRFAHRFEWKGTKADFDHIGEAHRRMATDAGLDPTTFLLQIVAMAPRFM